MNKLEIDQTITLHIHGLGSSGEGVGYFNDYAIFVDGALPGETVEARLFRTQKRCGWAQLTKVITPSSDRITPICNYFGECGGCQLMHLAYAKQLEMKRQRVVDAIQRIGKIESCEIAPCLPSPHSLGYRNKIQLPVRKKNEGIALGLYARSSHDLVEIEGCHIHCSMGEQVYKLASEIIKHSGIEPYDPQTGEGELRHLLIKSAVNTEEALVILVTNRKATPLLAHIAKEIMAKCPYVKGVVHNLQSGRDNVILGHTYTTLEGSGYIQELLSELTFKVSPASFFQVNPQQAEQLYNQALTFAELSGNETVLDAYCGVGTLSLYFAKNAKKVIGIECVPEAIADAKENAKINQIQNCSFICAPVEAYISSLSNIDVALLNPPRKGCELSFLKGIARIAPKKIIYISCDPATLARDLAHLQQFGYAINQIQPFDMFPQTSHVECVVKLSLSITR